MLRDVMITTAGTTQTKRTPRDGFYTETEVLTAMDWKPWTLRQHVRKGLPVVMVGNTRLYPQDGFRDYLNSLVRQAYT